MGRLQSACPAQWVGAGLVFAAVIWPGLLAAEPVAVRYTEGALHGFLVLRTLDDKLLADGDVTQTVDSDRVTARLVFNFKDGSRMEQTTVYSQRQHFRLISDRVVQKGPAFPQPLDMSVDGTSGKVTVRYQDERGQSQTETEQFDVPPDLANGIVAKLLMNAQPSAMPTSFSIIAATPKPRMLRLVISPGGRDRFSVGGSGRQATHHVLKVEIDGFGRRGRTANRQATARFSRLDCGRRGACVCPGRAAALCWRPGVANRARRPGLAEDGAGAQRKGRTRQTPSTGLRQFVWRCRFRLRGGHRADGALF